MYSSVCLVSPFSHLTSYPPTKCNLYFYSFFDTVDRLCGLVIRVLGYRFGGPALPEKKEKVVGLERSPLSLVSTTEKLLDRKVTAPV
jgi:hypothetical protein